MATYLHMMMKSKTEADWGMLLNDSYAKVESWLSGMPDEYWLVQIDNDWTVKDLIGHLAAWSNLLLDQIETLVQGDPEKIRQIDIDCWNAGQIELRRSWSIAKIREEWEQSSQRAQNMIAQIPTKTFSQEWQVAWSKEPIAINDLFDLWLLHLVQHQEAWKSEPKV